VLTNGVLLLVFAFIFTAVTPAGLGQQTSTYDSRGLPLIETPATGGTIKNQYDAMGGLIERVDESGATNTTTYARDPLGRVTKVTYPDTTFEQTVYEETTGMVSATQDRAGQWLSFQYDAGGRVIAVHRGPDPTAPNSTVTQYDYDAAGRLKRAANKDAAVEYGNYDLLGHPRTTNAYRYANDTGLNDLASRILRDAHTQGHVWNVFGERTRWRMPAAGSALPPTETVGSWRTWIDETHDGAGNLTKQLAVASQTGPAAGPSITATTPFGAGEPGTRTRGLDGGGSIVSSYVYNDGGMALPAALSAASSTLASTEGTGRLQQLSTTHGTAIVAGNTMFPDRSKRVGAQLDLALGDRGSRFGYDGRGRMDHSKLHLPSEDDGLVTATTGATVDTYSPADFHKSVTSTMGLTPAQHATLGTTASLAVEPPVWSASEKPAHQIDVRSLMLDGAVTDTRTYQFTDGRRKSDGVWTSSYDEFGRLATIENNPPSGSAAPHRRIVASYDPQNRLVGRTAYHQEGANWVIDTAGTDGLPPDITLLWDPIADRLLSIVEAGKSVDVSAPPEAGLLRQYVHGDQGYDDPVEVLVADGTEVKRYLPVIDEAGTGSIEAVLDGRSGDVVERVLYGDAYGASPKYLQGPIVDKLTFEVEKDGGGVVKKVTVEAHLSERIVEASAADGLRLRTLTNAGMSPQLHLAARRSTRTSPTRCTGN
jgi:YD repeat-containing protein